MMRLITILNFIQEHEVLNFQENQNVKVALQNPKHHQGPLIIKIELESPRLEED